MKNKHSVSGPADFKEVIVDILDWYKEIRENVLVIALQGDLGVGKTTFTQELGRYLGVNETITSPTFTIMKKYELAYEKFDLLVHIDAYRIEDESEVSPLRLDEVLHRPNTLVCVEWPEQIIGVLPKTAVWVNISITENESRTVTVRFPSEK